MCLTSTLILSPFFRNHNITTHNTIRKHNRTHFKTYKSLGATKLNSTSGTQWSATAGIKLSNWILTLTPTFQTLSHTNMCIPAAICTLPSDAEEKHQGGFALLASHNQHEMQAVDSFNPRIASLTQRTHMTEWSDRIEWKEDDAKFPRMCENIIHIVPWFIFGQ